MTWLLVLAGVLAALWLLGRIRLGVGAEYRAEGLRVWLRAGPLQIGIFPLKKKQPEKKKDGKKGAKKPAPGGEEPQPGLPERVGGALEYAKALLPVALEAAGQFRRKLRVDSLALEVTVGAEDPATAAIRYGQANGALAAAWAALNEAFDLRDGHAWVRVDFDAGETRVYALAALSLRLGQVTWLGIYFGCRTLRAFLRVRSRRKQEQQQRKAA